VASVLEYQDRSVEQGHDDRSASTLQLQSGEAVRRVASTKAAAFPKLQLVMGSAVRCTKIVDVFTCKLACQHSRLKKPLESNLR